MTATLIAAVAEHRAKVAGDDRRGAIFLDLERARRGAEDARTKAEAAAGKPASIRRQARLEFLDAMETFEVCAAAAREAGVI